MNCPIRITSHNLPDQFAAESRWFIWICLENSNGLSWPETAESVKSEIHVWLNGNYHLSLSLPRSTFDPYEKKYFYFCFIAPSSPAKYDIKLKLIAGYSSREEKFEVDQCQTKFRVSPKEHSLTNTHLATALYRNSWFYLPSQGLTRGRDSNSYPIFVKKAKGSNFIDTSGNRYVDYVMGWGSSLLGHAHPAVCKAVSKTIKNGSMLSLPHHMEMEVTTMLCSIFKSAEAVLFGKNGSDVTTAAIRLARVFTGRNHILFCGYHGWQDAFTEPIGFYHSGVPDNTSPTMHAFKYGDIANLKNLLKQYSGNVAAIMIEPAGVIESIQGPIHDADSQFLEELSNLARESEILVIFDEIMTGFRYLGGSVHQYCRIRPDLICLGKGLSSGMPLSALIGRADIFNKCMPNIYYHPTFKGDVASLAAAKAALEIYQKHNIPDHIWRYGRQLAQGIERLFAQYDIPASIIGPPFRMAISFHVERPNEQALLRTLLHQELLKNRVFTFNTIMLPSFAHDKSDLLKTFTAFEKSLQTIQRVMKKGNFAEVLEIPEVVSHTEPMCLTPDVSA
jgi:glutamate-1-semialdehyde 2,1-aminomutase